MAYKKPNQNNIDLEPIMIFLQKYWLIIAGLIFALPWIKNYLDEMKATNIKSALENQVEVNEQKAEAVKDNILLENKNPLTQKEKRLKITGSSELWAASSSLAHHFGVSYSDNGKWYDFLNPRGFTENDEEIRNILLKYRNYFTKLEKLYFVVDTNSRSLRKDILQYLDKDSLKTVRRGLNI